MSKTIVSVRYVGQCGGFLSIEKTADGIGHLHLDSTLPDASTHMDNYYFQQEDAGSWGEAMGTKFREVRFRSCVYMTKFITGYGISYIVKGEPSTPAQDGEPNDYSNWQIHSYDDVIGGEGHENLVALYNSASERYMVIKVKGKYDSDNPEYNFYLSDNIKEDVEQYGKFVIDSVPY